MWAFYEKVKYKKLKIEDIEKKIIKYDKVKNKIWNLKFETKRYWQMKKFKLNFELQIKYS